MEMHDHWGTLQSDVEASHVSLNHKQLYKPHALDVEGSMLHQPFSQSDTVKDKDNFSELFSIDPMISHSIEVLQYIRTLRTFIKNGQETMESYKIDDTAGAEPPTLPDAPPIPIYSTTKDSKILSFASPEETDFTKGIGETPIEIDNDMCHHLLRKSIGVMCAHLGYDVCKESVLAELTDATKLYYKKLTTALRQAVNVDSNGSGNYHQDCVEVILNECGIGGVSGLHQFYNDRVINYQQHLTFTAEQLLEDYKILQHPEAHREVIKSETVLDITFPGRVEPNIDDDNIDSAVSLDMNIDDVVKSQKRASQSAQQY